MSRNPGPRAAQASRAPRGRHVQLQVGELLLADVPARARRLRGGDGPLGPPGRRRGWRLRADEDAQAGRELMLVAVQKQTKLIGDLQQALLAKQTRKEEQREERARAPNLPRGDTRRTCRWRP